MSSVHHSPPSKPLPPPPVPYLSSNSQTDKAGVEECTPKNFFSGKQSLGELINQAIAQYNADHQLFGTPQEVFLQQMADMSVYPIDPQSGEFAAHGQLPTGVGANGCATLHLEYTLRFCQKSQEITIRIPQVWETDFAVPTPGTLAEEHFQRRVQALFILFRHRVTSCFGTDQRGERVCYQSRMGQLCALKRFNWMENVITTSGPQGFYRKKILPFAMGSLGDLHHHRFIKAVIVDWRLKYINPKFTESKEIEGTDSGFYLRVTNPILELRRQELEKIETVPAILATLYPEQKERLFKEESERVVDVLSQLEGLDLLSPETKEAINFPNVYASCCAERSLAVVQKQKQDLLSQWPSLVKTGAEDYLRNHQEIDRLKKKLNKSDAERQELEARIDLLTMCEKIGGARRTMQNVDLQQQSATRICVSRALEARGQLAQLTKSLAALRALEPDRNKWPTGLAAELQDVGFETGGQQARWPLKQRIEEFIEKGLKLIPESDLSALDFPIPEEVPSYLDQLPAEPYTPSQEPRENCTPLEAMEWAIDQYNTRLKPPYRQPLTLDDVARITVSPLDPVTKQPALPGELPTGTTEKQHAFFLLDYGLEFVRGASKITIHVSQKCTTSYEIPYPDTLEEELFCRQVQSLFILIRAHISSSIFEDANRTTRFSRYLCSFTNFEPHGMMQKDYANETFYGRKISSCPKGSLRNLSELSCPGAVKIDGLWRYADPKMQRQEAKEEEIKRELLREEQLHAGWTFRDKIKRPMPIGYFKTVSEEGVLDDTDEAFHFRVTNRATDGLRAAVDGVEGYIRESKPLPPMTEETKSKVFQAEAVKAADIMAQFRGLDLKETKQGLQFPYGSELKLSFKEVPEALNTHSQKLVKLYELFRMIAVEGGYVSEGRVYDGKLYQQNLDRITAWNSVLVKNKDEKKDLETCLYIKEMLEMIASGERSVKDYNLTYNNKSRNWLRRAAEYEKHLDQLKLSIATLEALCPNTDQWPKDLVRELKKGGFSFGQYSGEGNLEELVRKFIETVRTTFHESVVEVASGWTGPTKRHCPVVSGVSLGLHRTNTEEPSPLCTDDDDAAYLPSWQQKVIEK